MEKITFVLSDDSLNSYGFRILTAGLVLDHFKSNPVMLYAHIRSDEHYGKKEPILPIGNWENIRMEGDKLLADAVFDEDDEFSMKVYKKVKKRILNTASVGVSPLEWSEDPEDMLPGQLLPTIVKGIVKECSIADIPGNANALRLEHDGVVIRLGLSDSNPQDLKKLFNSQTSTIPMEKLITLLNSTFGFNLSLKSSDTDVAEQVRLSMEKLQKDNKALSEKVETLTGEKTDLQTKLADQSTAAHKAKVDALLTGAVADKKITEAEKETYAKLAATEEGFNAVDELIKGKKAYKSVTEQLQASGTTTPDVVDNAEEFDKLRKANKLEEVKQSNPERFNELFKAKYGREYKPN